MLSGCITCSASACGMLSCFWLSVALSSPMRPCGAGARNSARALPTACAAAGHGRETSGTSTRCSSGSRACSTISGVPWIRTALCSTSWFRTRRDAKAAKRFFRRLLKGLQYVPRVIVTDKLRSYGVAQRQSASRGRASTKPISEQSRRELTSTDTTPRTADATVQIAGAGSELPLRSRIHPWPLPSTPTPPGSQCLSRDPVEALMSGSRRRAPDTQRDLRCASASKVPARPSEVNVTMPPARLAPISRRNTAVAANAPIHALRHDQRDRTEYEPWPASDPRAARRTISLIKSPPTPAPSWFRHHRDQAKLAIPIDHRRSPAGSCLGGFRTPAHASTS